MPPFTTLNGQTGYFDNSGQFVAASQEQYNQQFGMLQQFGNNPFISAQQTFTQQPQSIQQGAIQPPMAGQMTNEQKVMQAQGDNSSMLGNMPYVQKGNELGVQKGKSFFPYNASTASGHPLNTATNTVFNAYDLTTNRKNDIVNPYAAQSALMQSQNAASFLNNLSNKPAAPAAPTQAQVTSPITTGATEIIPAPTTEQAEGGNWFSNMFNKPSVEGVPAADNITNVVEKGPGLFKQSKDFFGSEAGQATSAGIGAGLGIATSLAARNASVYDQRVGMSKPNALGTIASDSTVTQIGLNPALMAATGGLSAVAGLTIDDIKNSIKYVKQKDKYENKKLAVDTMQSLDDARENIKPDYTGYARNGIQVSNPYLQAQAGTEVIVDKKKINTDSKEYKEMYASGNLMRVDEGGMPTMTTEDLVITGQMTDNTREQREIQKERDAQGLNYNWSAGSQNPYMSQPKSTVSTGINYTVPSVPPFQPIFNPEDDYLKDYVGKSLGEHPFIFSSKSEVGMGYNNFGNNTWMSSGLGTVDDSPTIMGHLSTRYNNNDAYKVSLENNDIPSLYFFYKDLSKEKNWQEDVGVSTTKYYDSRNELMDMGDTYEREGRFIDDIVKKQGYGHNLVMDENGNKLIRSFTADKDKFMGSVTLTPEMYKALLEAPNQTEAKRRLMQMAKIPQDVDMDKLFIHMNLSKPKNLSTYFKAKTVNPNSVRNWHDVPPGNIYINRVFQNKKQPTNYHNETRLKKHRIGGMAQNPYLMAQYGTDLKKKPIYTGQDKSPNYKSNVTIDGKQIGKGSQEYKDAYDSGNLMSVDYDGMPVMYSNQQAEVTAEAPAWLKQQREREKDPVAFAVRKGTGDFATGTAQGVGTVLGYTGEVMNTPLALLGETLSGRGDYYSALPNLTRTMKDMGLENQLTSEDKKWLPKNDQMTPGALVSDNPLIQMGIDVPLDILTGKAFTKTSKYAKQINNLQNVLPTLFKSKVPKINVTDINKFKNKTGIDYVKNVTSDPRYAQKAKELDVKYGDASIQERPTNSNLTLTDQQQTTDFNPLARQLTLRETRTRRPLRNNDYRPSLRFGPFQQREYFEDAAGPFTRMSNYTQTPEYYKNIFTNVDFGDEYLRNLNKPKNDLTTEEIKEALNQSRILGRFTPGLNLTQVSVDKALPHELKHKEHYTTKWRNQFPEKYKEVISQNFDETNVTDDYTKYRLDPDEQEAWLSRDLKKSMVDKGFIKSPFEQIDETTLDKFIETDYEIFTPELVKRLNKKNFLKWLNETLPAVTGVATAGTIGSQLMSQEESAFEQKRQGGKTNPYLK
jgi:hypothetical protein